MRQRSPCRRRWLSESRRPASTCVLLQRAFAPNAKGTWCTGAAHARSTRDSVVPASRPADQPPGKDPADVLRGVARPRAPQPAPQARPAPPASQSSTKAPAAQPDAPRSPPKRRRSSSNAHARAARRSVERPRLQQASVSIPIPASRSSRKNAALPRHPTRGVSNAGVKQGKAPPRSTEDGQDAQAVPGEGIRTNRRSTFRRRRERAEYGIDADSASMPSHSAVASSSGQAPARAPPPAGQVVGAGGGSLVGVVTPLSAPKAVMASPSRSSGQPQAKMSGSS